LEQYELLKSYGLEGGIAYRGLALDLKHAIQMLSTKAMRGTSWTSNYFLALHFASQNNVEGIMKKVFAGEEGFKVGSAREFQRLIVKAKSQKLYDKRLYILVDDPDVALNILVMIQESKKEALKKAKPYHVEVAPKHETSVGFTSKGDATIGAILSYDVINDKVMVYLGEGAPKHFVSEKWLDQKEIVVSIPKRFRLNPSAVDIVIPIVIKFLELEFIGKEGFAIVKPVLEENNVPREVIEFIDAEKNKITVDRLNAYLKSQKVHGKIIGKVNVASRKK
jgi:hypothetical protein